MGPETRHRMGSRVPSAVRRDEDQRLHDLAQLRADGGGRVLGGVGGLGEDVDVEGHALARRGVDDPLGRRGQRRLGHGPKGTRPPRRPAVAGGYDPIAMSDPQRASRAPRPPRHRGGRRRRPGARRPRRRVAGLGRGRRSRSSRRTAASRGPGPSGWSPRSWWATWTRSPPACSPLPRRRGPRCCGRPRTRTSRTRSSPSSRRCAAARRGSRCWAPSAGPASTTRWPTCGSSRTPASPAWRWSCSTRGPGSFLVSAPGPDDAPGAPPPARSGRCRRVAAAPGRRRVRHHDAGPPLPAARRAARHGSRPRPVQRPDRHGRRRHGAARPPPRRGDPRPRRRGLSSGT